MKVETVERLHFEEEEKYVLKELRDFCISQRCPGCPLEHFCDKHFNDTSSFKDMCNDLLAQ